MTGPVLTKDEQIKKLECLLAQTARSIPCLLLYATKYPGDSHVREALATLRELAEDGPDPDYYGRLLRHGPVPDLIRLEAQRTAP